MTTPPPRKRATRKRATPPPAPAGGDDLADLADVLPPVRPTSPPTRSIQTLAGVAALDRGATLDEALAVDAAEIARLDAEDAAEEAEREHRRQVAVERADRQRAEEERRAAAAARLDEKRQLDLIEQRLRVQDRIRRAKRRAESEDEGP